MGGKRNKVRYQSKVKEKKTLSLSGKVYLQYVDEDAIAAAGAGDLLVYAENRELHTTRPGAYGSDGFTGYFKVDVSDGKQWCALLISDIFSGGENHFSRKEYPIDTYRVCLEILKGLKGRSIYRTYREHYALEEDAGGEV